MARSVMLNLIGNNQTSHAFRAAADDADRLSDRLGRAEVSSARASRTFAALTGRTATLASALLTVAPAAGAAGAAVVAGAGAMTAAFGAATVALGAFGLAAKSQLSGVGNVSDAWTKAREAAVQYGAGSKEAAEATAAYNKQLAALPPATRETAKAFIGLRQDFKAWSDSLSGDTMPVFSKGIHILRRALPALTPLVKTGADALWDFLVPIERGVKSGGFKDWAKRVNEIAKKSLPALLRSAGNVAKGIGGIFEAFLPHAPGMARGIEGLTERFAAWGQSLKSSEGFKTFIDYVRQNLPALSTTFGNLVQIVVNLATAFAPLSGISLEIVKGFTGILAALPPEVLTLLVGGFVALTTAIRILTPVMRVLNVVMRMNPIGLIVTALGLLVAGLVLAYKRSETFRNIVDGAWSAVSRAVSTAWREWIKPALNGLADLFRDAYNTWQKLWPAMEQLLTEVAAFFTDTLKGAVDTVAGAFGGLGEKATEASTKISGVGQGFESTKEDGNSFLSWSTFFGGMIGQIFGGFTGAALGAVTVHFWPKVKGAFKDGFKNIGGDVRGFVAWLPGALGRGLTSAGGALAGGMRRLHRRLTEGLPPLRMSWTSHWNWVKTFAGNVMDLLGDVTRRGMRAIAGAFDRGVAAVRTVWRRLPGAVKAPINWIINEGYNGGIRRLWNAVMGWLKLPGGLQLGRVRGLERGGTLADPMPAKPMMTNGPMAIVGEGRQAYPEFVIPTDPKYRGRAQALWAAAGGHLQMLERGGVLGSVLGAVKKVAGKVSGIAKSGVDLLADPKGVWDRLAARMVPGSGHLAKDKWGTAMSKVVPQMLSRAWGAASQIITTFKKAFGGDAHGVVKAAASMIGRGDDRGENNNWLTRAWGMPGAPWCAIFVSEAIKQARATKRYKGYPSAAVASYVAGMRHVGRTEGRPGDLGAYRGTGHINVIARNLGGGVYETIGGNEGPRVKRSRRGGQSAILRPMARGGVLGVYRQRNLDPADDRDPLLRALRSARVATYDSGGMLQPGATLAINNLGRPEPIFPSLEAAAAYGAGGGPLVNIEEVVVKEKADVDLLADRLGFTVRAAAF